MTGSKLLMLATLAAATGCSSYVLPVPNDFSPANALPVTGASGFKQKTMTVGDYTVAIDRGWTRSNDEGGDLVRAARRRQNYSFVMRRADAIAFSGGCTLAANETTVGAPAGIRITASEKAELYCELLPNGTGKDSWKLELNGDPDNPLNGGYHGKQRYTVQGIGTAIGSTKHGPTAGYYIQQDGRTVATVQTTNKRQVVFAPNAQSDELIAAAVVLLLIDESVRDLDD
jgi:hypothetical protein